VRRRRQTARSPGMPPLVDRRIGFMGSGQMAEALAKGLINKGVVTPNQICCTDPVPARKELFKGFGAAAYDTSLEVRGILYVGPETIPIFSSSMSWLRPNATLLLALHLGRRALASATPESVNSQGPNAATECSRAAAAHALCSHGLRVSPLSNQSGPLAKHCLFCPANKHTTQHTHTHTHTHTDTHTHTHARTLMQPRGVTPRWSTTLTCCLWP
jgi:hypothetical protein